DGAFTHQAAQALEVDARQIAGGLNCGELRLLLAGIELHEQVTFMHGRAGLESDPADNARKIRADRHTLNCGYCSNSVQRYRPFFVFRDDGRDSFGWRLKRGALCDGFLNLYELHKAERSDQPDRYRQHQNHSFPHEPNQCNERTTTKLLNS